MIATLPGSELVFDADSVTPADREAVAADIRAVFPEWGDLPVHVCALTRWH